MSSLPEASQITSRPRLRPKDKTNKSDEELQNQQNDETDGITENDIKRTTESAKLGENKIVGKVCLKEHKGKSTVCKLFKREIHIYKPIIHIHVVNPSKNEDRLLQNWHIAIIVLLSLCLLIALLSICLLASSHFATAEPDTKPVLSLLQIQDGLLETIDALRSEFPNQRKDTWSTIGSSISSVYEEYEPSQPSILLFISDNNNVAIRDCMIKKVVTGKWSNSTYSPEDAARISPVQLSQYLNGAAEKNRPAVVHNINTITLPSARILHGICNNDNNAHMRAIYIFTTMKHNPNITITSNSNAREVAFEVLSHAWEHIDKSERDSVISRVSVSPVVVLGEEKNPC